MFVPAGLSNVVSLASGSHHALALKSDGTVVVWGSGGNVVTNVPSSVSNVVAITAGFEVSFALRGDGKVIGWGNGRGTEIVPSGLSNVVAIATHHALKADGTVVAWGNDLRGPSSVPAGLEQVVAIADTGFNGGIALKEDGTVCAWDWNGNILLDLPPGLVNVTAIARGGSHYLALKSDGTVVAWGNNTYGQTNVPEGASNIVSIAAGGAHNLALKADGMVIAWGAGTNYVPGIDSPAKGQSIVPPQLTNAVAISGGETFSLAIEETGAPFLSSPLLNRKVGEGTHTVMRISAVGAGLNYQWQFFGTNIPDATNSSLSIPETLLSHAGPYSVVVSNTRGSAASSNILEVVPILITSNPAKTFAFMWGDATLSAIAHGREPLLFQWKFNGANIIGQTNSFLQLTNLQLSQAGDYWVVVTNGVGFAVSQSANLALSQVAVWGGRNGPQTIPEGWTNILAIAAGDGSMVLRSDGTVSAVGRNVPNGWTNVPAGLNNVAAIAASQTESCGMALRTNGTVTVWGDNSYHQNLIPQGLSNVVAIATGAGQCLALKSDGTITAWGDRTDIPSGFSNIVAMAGGFVNKLLLTGNGEVLSFGNLQPPTNLTHIIAIAAGFQHNMALREDGTIVAWGDNSAGQTNVPAGLSNVVAIACGEYHSVALTRDGRTVVWGNNGYGQTNLPSGLPQTIAISGGAYHNLALVGGHPPVLTTQLTNLVKTEAGFRLSLPTQSGCVYRLEYKNSLEETNWNALPLVAGNGGSVVLTDATATSSQRIYRVRRW